MAKPRVFISSTYYDLKHIRSSLETFIESIGYEPILSEKGTIAFNPDIPLDESCYREAQNSDIFVIIIGGRYGSPASIEGETQSDKFHERYESVTKLEYEYALKKEIPIYILIDKSVNAEYETFKKNRKNETIKYAHVDSINIFLLIDKILKQPRNNPVHQFEKHTDIENWLREQWAGLFQELIRTRSNQTELSELSTQVKQLSNINTTLKRYLEELVSSSDDKKGKEIIKEEEKRLTDVAKKIKFQDHEFGKALIFISDLGVTSAIKLVSENNTWEDFAREYALLLNEKDNGKRLLSYWNASNNKHVRVKFNELREILGLPKFKHKRKK